MRRASTRVYLALGTALVAGLAFVWSTPVLWMLVASIRVQKGGGLGMASLVPEWPPTFANFAEAWSYAEFPLYYLNTALLVAGILAVQCVTITLAGYAFARLQFRGREFLFTIFLLQLMLVPPLLIVPNLTVVTRLGLYDSLLGVMAPYWASAFGTFLMRQTFRQIPRAFEEAAVMDGARWWQVVKDVLIPLARPGLIAFSVISVTSHWNEFLWPLMVINSPDKHVLTVGLATFTKGAEGASDWGVIAAGTCLVAVPLLVAFVAFQRQFVSSFMFQSVR
jgi:sn-glycerol 3-phosphate transport system permease protein